MQFFCWIAALRKNFIAEKINFAIILGFCFFGGDYEKGFFNFFDFDV